MFDREETEGLIRAMETPMELYHEKSLDMEALTYDSAEDTTGRCRKVICFDKATVRYTKKLCILCSIYD